MNLTTLLCDTTRYLSSVLKRFASYASHFPILRVSQNLNRHTRLYCRTPLRHISFLLRSSYTCLAVSHFSVMEEVHDGASKIFWNTSRTEEEKTVLRTAKARGAAIARSSGLSIENDRLVGDDVSFVETPNKGGDLSPCYLVFHYTAGKSATSSINWLTNPESKASAHLVLARDGTIIQLAPLNVETWHAGISHWDGLSGLNRSSIWIEMDNAGPLKKVGDKYQVWFGTLYAEDQVFLAKHKLDDEPRWWHAYTEIQIQRALSLHTPCSALSTPGCGGE